MGPQFGAVVQVAEAAKAAGKAKKSVRCWKCSDNSHAVKDCKVNHYCYICDKKAHPTARCHVLKLPKPSVFVSGSGLLEIYFTSFPDSVLKEDLALTQSPIALVVVTGDAVPAYVIVKQVARRCSDYPNWKWEAVPHVDMQFLVSVPLFDDLDGIQVGCLLSAPPSPYRLGGLRRFFTRLNLRRCGCMWTGYLILYDTFWACGMLDHLLARLWMWILLV
jgi:hypothetical protein